MNPVSEGPRGRLVWRVALSQQFRAYDTAAGDGMRTLQRIDEIEVRIDAQEMKSGRQNVLRRNRCVQDITTIGGSFSDNFTGGRAGTCYQRGVGT